MLRPGAGYPVVGGGVCLLERSKDGHATAMCWLRRFSSFAVVVRWSARWWTGP